MESVDSDSAPPEAERPLRTSVAEPVTSTRTLDPPNSLAHLHREAGNRAFGRAIARMGDGEGIMPSGLVHPDVEAAIAMTRGAGSPMDRAVAGHLETAHGAGLRDVRVHTGETAVALTRAVSARAFTVGSDIYFGAGEYQPGTSDGKRLIAHEVAHVVQQRGAPMTGPLTVSQPGDALEREAEDLARAAPL